MKLFSLRLTTLKSKLYAIVFASLVVRVVAFFLLPSTPSKLAPDESIYSALTEWIADGRPADEFSYGNLYVSSKTLILPASILNGVGVNGLNSIRIISTLYALILMLLIVYLLLKLNDTRPVLHEFFSQNEKVAPSLLIVFGFLPSHFGWSILGLRESVLEFWVVCTFVLLYLLYEKRNSHSPFLLLGIGITITLTSASRPQIGLVLGFTLFFYSLGRINSKTSKSLLLIVLISTFLGNAITAPVTKYESEVHICESESAIITTSNMDYSCKTEIQIKTEIKIENPATTILNEVEGIPVRNQLNKLDAASAIKTQNCPHEEVSKIGRYLCMSWRAPYTTGTFLFRPIIGADVTSSTSLFAAIENIFWLSAFFFVILMFTRNRRLAFFGPLVPSLMFFSIYSVAAGAYEGNMGTAFRHKSLILWVVLLLIASTIVATQQRKAQQQGISGSSQE